MEEEPDALQELAERLGEGGKSTELCCKGGSDSGVEENCVQGNAEGASCDSSLVSYCNSSEELVSNSHQCECKHGLSKCGVLYCYMINVNFWDIQMDPKHKNGHTNLDQPRASIAFMILGA